MALFWGAILLEKSTSNSSIIWWHSSLEISALFIFHKFRVFMVGKLSGLGVFQQKGSACLRSTSATNNLTFTKLTVKKNKNIMSHSLDHLHAIRTIQKISPSEFTLDHRVTSFPGE